MKERIIEAFYTHQKAEVKEKIGKYIEDYRTANGKDIVPVSITATPYQTKKINDSNYVETYLVIAIFEEA